ncbi:MAG: response regulator transcription factor [Gammaproteobacteria bacterium]|nr:response regulator transcription factor [Gammaproteobacteria bacterium]
MTAEIRLVVVDDHTLFRRGLIALLAREPHLRVVGEASDAGEASRVVSLQRPDVILLDNHLPGVRGVDAVGALRDAVPGARVVMLTVSEDAADLGAALRAGASGYLLKSCDATELVSAIERAYHGEAVISPEMTSKLADAFAAPLVASTSAALDESVLSPRERQVAAAVAGGSSNKEIARELKIAEATVKIHVASILRKLDLTSRVEIAVYASEHGWRDQNR